MQAKRIAGLAASFDKPSRTVGVVGQIGELARQRYDMEPCLLTLENFGPSLPAARQPEDLDPPTARPSHCSN